MVDFFIICFILLCILSKKLKECWLIDMYLKYDVTNDVYNEVSIFNKNNIILLRVAAENNILHFPMLLY